MPFRKTPATFCSKSMQDEKEIISLESKTNKILKDFQGQNDKVMRLYSDEVELEKNLALIFEDERSFTEKLGTIAKALEIVSDVDIRLSAASQARTCVLHALRGNFLTALCVQLQNLA
jgi:uncharacterized protein YeeX (DUF496 family)